MLPKPKENVLRKELQTSLSNIDAKILNKFFSKLNPEINKMKSKHQAHFARMQACFNILNQSINIIHYFKRKERGKNHLIQSSKQI